MMMQDDHDSLPKKAKSNFDQDYSGGKSAQITQNSVGKERYGGSNSN